MKKFTIQERITERECDSLDMYLREINKEKYNPLSSKEEVELAKQIKEGSKQALDKLVNANLRFGVSVAKAYQGNGLPLSDLINEASIGLVKAAHKFDETRGFKFISYAVWWLRQSILQSIAENSKIIRLPMNQVNNSSKIKKAKKDLIQDLQRTPTISEISEYLALSENDINLVELHSNKVKSFSSPINDEESSTLEDIIPNEGGESDSLLMENSLFKEIKSVLSTFSDRDREIIELSFGIGKEYPMDDEEIANRYGLTRERIRQIKKKLRGIKDDPNHGDVLKTFL